MKTHIFILFLFCAFDLHAQELSGIKFYDGDWNDAIIKAKDENKKIFIDFYTEWCGPCLTMSLQVFPLPQVGEVYNKNFICLKIDAEKGEGRELAKRYNVSLYPTYIFVNPDNQEIIHRSGSNKSAEDFIYDAQGAINPKLSSLYLEQKYLDGDYDKEFLIDFIKYKKTNGSRELLPLFTELINMGNSLKDSSIWEIFYKYINGYDNIYFNQVIDNYNEFVELYGKEKVDNKLAQCTLHAPIELLNKLPKFEGKYQNMKSKELTDLFRYKKYNEAFKLVDELLDDSQIDQQKLITTLSFNVRISPKNTDDNLPFDVIANKVKLLRYIAYNNYNRDDAMPHYYYSVGLEYLIHRAVKEDKEIPNYILEKPKYGNTEYTMRHPLLKQKPLRIK